MSDDLKIGIVGVGGRMGQMLVRQVTATEGCRIAGATERGEAPFSEKTRAASPVSATSASASSTTRRR